MYDVDKLNSLNILEVANKLGIDINNSYKSICFLHSETKPSLQFYPKTNSWYCYGCGIGGKVIDLIKYHLNIDFINACQWLENNYKIGSSIKTFNNINTIKRISKPINKKCETKKGNNEINKWVINMLALDKKAIDYLVEKRKIQLNTIEKYGIKSISNIKWFYNELNKFYDLPSLIEAGYYKITVEGEVKPVWWTSGIIIPYFNKNKHIQTFQMRCYDDSYVKYVFLSNVENCVFNENILGELKQLDKVIICEGAFDALCLCERGFNAVAIPGANSMKDAWYSLFEHFNNIILFDNDDTGKKNAAIIKSKMLNQGINAQIFNLGKYKDLNEMIIDEIKNKELK